MRIFILLLGAILLTLIWTNPSTADFEKWAQKETLSAAPNSNVQHIFVRSRNYLLFSYHEFYARDEQGWQHAYYAGFGILKTFVLSSSTGDKGKKSPAF